MPEIKCYVDQAEAGAVDGDKEEEEGEEEKNEAEGEYDPAVAKGTRIFCFCTFDTLDYHF